MRLFVSLFSKHLSVCIYESMWVGTHFQVLNEKENYSESSLVNLTICVCDVNELLWFQYIHKLQPVSARVHLTVL